MSNCNSAQIQYDKTIQEHQTERRDQAARTRAVNQHHEILSKLDHIQQQLSTLLKGGLVALVLLLPSVAHSATMGSFSLINGPETVGTGTWTAQDIIIDPARFPYASVVAPLTDFSLNFLGHAWEADGSAYVQYTGRTPVGGIQWADVSFSSVLEGVGRLRVWAWDISRPYGPIEYTGYEFTPYTALTQTFGGVRTVISTPATAPVPTPEPSTFLLLGTGLAWVAYRKMRVLQEGESC